MDQVCVPGDQTSDQSQQKWTHVNASLCINPSFIYSIVIVVVFWDHMVDRSICQPLLSSKQRSEVDVIRFPTLWGVLPHIVPF